MEASRLGYQLLLFNTKDRESKLSEYVEQCRRNRVAGIILFSPDLKDGGVLENPHIPVVTIERAFTCATACIECDNLMGESCRRNI